MSFVPYCSTHGIWTRSSDTLDETPVEWYRMYLVPLTICFENVSFIMVSAKAAEDDGVDEGVAQDSETEYIRSRKASDLEHEASSKAYQFCHYPKNPFCKVCQKAHMMAPPAKKKGGQKRLETKSFGDHIVADHTVVEANVEEGVKGETVALVMKDIHTQFRHVYPSQTKSSE